MFLLKRRLLSPYYALLFGAKQGSFTQPSRLFELFGEDSPPKGAKLTVFSRLQGVFPPSGLELGRRPMR
jgi:hypothetical protein